MRLERFLGIDLPIIQAPLAGVQDSRLTVAVCNAGGLGSLPCALLSPEAMVQELERIREQTDKPYNINFFCHQPPAADPGRESEWRKTLDPYYREFGIDPASVVSGPGRAPFTAQTLELIAPYRPPVVSFHFGLPPRQLLEPIKAWGGKVLSSATTVEEACWLEANGADLILAQGLEAGGHRGMFMTGDLTTQVGTLALLPQIIEAVELPVVATGGIADAAGVSAVMGMGAAGAQVGTAYMLCPEATTSPLHRAAMQSKTARHTALTNLFTGRPARGIVNRVMRELGPISFKPSAFPLAVAAMLPLRAAAEARGSDGFSPLWCGQNVSGCQGIPAAELTRQLAALSRTAVE